MANNSAIHEKRVEHHWERKLVNLLTSVFFAGIVIILLLPLFSKSSWLIFVQDDFLYYLKVAQNVVHGHGSTFNRVVPTNGYQPLWFIVLLALSCVTENGHTILGFLAAVNLCCAIVTFLLARRLIQAANISPLLTFSLAAWVTLYSVSLFFYGMEVTLTVPIILGVICLLRNVNWLMESSVHTFLTGLLLSVMVLSRIDTLILGGLILGGIILTPPLRRMLNFRLFIALVAGLIPLLIYFALNHLIFDTWLPVSGMAKELKLTHVPSMEPWKVFFHPLAGGFTLLLVSSLLIFPKVMHRMSAMEQIVFPSVVLFPFVYYFILSCVSDWTLWGWYMYPIRTALCVSFLILCLWAPSRQLLQAPIVTTLLILSVFACLCLLRWTQQQKDIYAASVEIQQFAMNHPGVYAMGDRAGRVAYLIDDPVIQTEGLMMDRPYLQFLKKQVPLRDMLTQYRVQYYIATAYTPFSGCFEATEPAKAGPQSAHMHDKFCEKPSAIFLHDGIKTMIFDLSSKSYVVRPRPLE